MAEFNEVNLQASHRQLNQPAVRTKFGANNFSLQQFTILLKTLVNEGVFTEDQVNNNDFDQATYFSRLLQTYPELKFDEHTHDVAEAPKGGAGKFIVLFIIIALCAAGYVFKDKIKEAIDSNPTMKEKLNDTLDSVKEAVPK